MLGAIAEGQAAAAPPKPAAVAAAPQPKAAPVPATAAPQQPKAAASPQPQAAPAYASAAPQPAQARAANDEILAPSVRRLSEESGVDPASVNGTGKDGRVTKGDMLAVIEGGASRPQPATAPAAAAVSFAAPQAPQAVQARQPVLPSEDGREERVRMTKLRQTIARRLKEAQNNAAMLTTFNEVDMSTIMAVRNQYKDCSRRSTA